MNNLLDNITIILHEPRYPENIGAAARCCKNMSVGGGLILINPELPDMEKMLKMATHEASSIIENMKTFQSLEDALAGFNYIFGTTARTGKKRVPTHSPKEAANTACSLLHNNRVGILFGSERWGLQNVHLDMCHGLIRIPTAEFSSINLAQSVMIIVYEIFVTASEKPESFMPRLASFHESQGMYEHISQLFEEAGFVKRENPDYWVSHVRRFLSSYPLKARDARMIRGFCRQLLFALSKGR